MDDLARRLADLSPEKRKLLIQTLRQRGSAFNTFPLSSTQHRLWFLDRWEPGSTAYNVPGGLRLRGALDRDVLHASLQQIVRRHEALRTIFLEIDGAPLQLIRPPFTLDLPLVDLLDLAADERDQRVAQIMRDEATEPFDLQRGPLVRARLVRLAADDHLLLITFHHIVADGWSLGVLVRELTQLYAARGSADGLPNLAVQFGDWATWQRNLLTGDGAQRSLDFWREQLAGDLPVLDLPSDRPRPTRQTMRGARQPIKIDAALADRLRALAQREGATLFMVLLAAFDTLLYRYTGTRDLLVGSPIAGRTRAETENLIGCFVNTLVLRTAIDGALTFRELLARVKQTAVAAYAHQDVPFERLVELLQPERSQSHSPIFQVMCAVQPSPIDTIETAGLVMTPELPPTDTAKFDLTLDLTETPSALGGFFEYNSDLFDADRIARMAEHLLALLHAVADDPARTIGAIDLLSADEHALLRRWNESVFEPPRESIVAHVEAQAAHTPESIAVIAGDSQLSYAELNARANRLARHLRGLGVTPETRVGLCADRTIDVPVALLAILKAGGVYVPLDPDYPPARLQFMIDDADVAVVLTQQHLLADLSATGARLGNAAIVAIDSLGATLASLSADNLNCPIDQQNLAYLIYTSGSTGTPKAVGVPHEALAAHAVSIAQAYKLTSADRVLQFSSLSFDTSIEQLLVPLSIGACVVLRGAELWSYETLSAALSAYGLTVINLPPAYWQQWIDALIDDPEAVSGHTLRLMIVGGEALTPETARRWRETPLGAVRLLNAYGPTETAVTATVFDVPAVPLESLSAMPIGRPTAGRRAYILDRDRASAPIGVPGELFLGGIGLARGYLGRPALTAERFVPNPFVASTNREDPEPPAHRQSNGSAGEASSSARLYRTGDLARFRADGTIEFLGRVDHQVKIRGYRIELGEIETLLRQQAGVMDGVVLARSDGGDARILAYIVAAAERPIAAATLREALERSLPAYMVPSAFVLLDALPLSPQGKVDRRALPAPDESSDEDELIAPRTPLEEVVAGIWCEVLDRDEIGVTQNFFHVGGHSLLATQVVAHLRDVFRIDLPLRALFDVPTIAGQAGRILEIAPDRRAVERTAEMLLEIAELSDDEIESELADRQA